MTGTAWTLVRWGIAVAIVVVVLAQFDLSAIEARLAAVDVRLAVPAVAGLIAIHLLGAATWRRLHERLLGVRLPWPATIVRYYAAQAIGSITPANLGSDVYRVAGADEETGRVAAALPVVAQRVTSIGAILILGALGASGIGLSGAEPVALPLVLAASGLGIAIALRWGGRVIASIARRFDERFATLADNGSWGAAAGEGLALGLAFHALGLLLGLLLVVAVDATTAQRWPEVLAALAVARVSLAIPISPSGLGIQEGAVAILFLQLGLPPEVALAATLLNRVALVAVVGLGAAAVLAGGRGRSAVTPNGRPRPTSAGMTRRIGDA